MIIFLIVICSVLFLIISSSFEKTPVTSKVNNSQTDETSSDKAMKKENNVPSENKGKDDVPVELTSEDAIKRLKEYLEIQQSDDVIIEFDSLQGEKYLLHVYDVIEEANNTEHTATRGWYFVHKRTGEIESMF